MDFLHFNIKLDTLHIYSILCTIISLLKFKFKFKDQKSLEFLKKSPKIFQLFLGVFGGDHEVFELFIYVCRPAGHKTTNAPLILISL